MSYLLTKRFFDIIFSLIFLVVLGIPMIFIAVCIKITSRGPFFYLSYRAGINNAYAGRKAILGNHEPLGYAGGV